MFWNKIVAKKKIKAKKRSTSFLGSKIDKDFLALINNSGCDSYSSPVLEDIMCVWQAQVRC